MNRERLKILSDMLKRHDEIFGRQGIKFDFYPAFCCEAAICPLGSACLYQPFRERGLRLDGSEPVYGGEKGLNAGKEFFGLKASEAHWLFDPDKYAYQAQAVDVARRVDALLTRTDNVSDMGF